MKLQHNTKKQECSIPGLNVQRFDHKIGVLTKTDAFSVFHRFAIKGMHALVASFAMREVSFDVQYVSFDVQYVSFDIQYVSFDIHYVSFEIQYVSFDIQYVSFDVYQVCFDIGRVFTYMQGLTFNGLFCLLTAMM